MNNYFTKAFLVLLSIVISQCATQSAIDNPKLNSQDNLNVFNEILFKSKVAELTGTLKENSIVEISEDNPIDSKIYDFYAIHYDEKENRGIWNTSQFDLNEFIFNEKLQYRKELKNSIKYALFIETLNTNNVNEYDFNKEEYNFKTSFANASLGGSSPPRFINNFLENFDSLVKVKIDPKTAKMINATVTENRYSPAKVKENKLLGKLITLYEINIHNKEISENDCLNFMGSKCIKFGRVKKKIKYIDYKLIKYNYIYNNQEFKNY